MGISLRPVGISPSGPFPEVGDAKMNLPTWVRLLHLARAGGWEPRGALPKLANILSLRAVVRTHGGLGDFAPGRVFDVDEAREFGDALRNAILDLAPDDISEEKLELEAEMPFPAAGGVAHTEWFGGTRRALVEHVATLALFGSFGVAAP